MILKLYPLKRNSNFALTLAGEEGEFERKNNKSFNPFRELELSYPLRYYEDYCKS